MGDPFVDILRNRNYADRKIMPDVNIFKGKPDSERAFPSVNKLYKEIAETVNKITGGNEQKAGYVDVSPESYGPPLRHHSAHGRQGWRGTRRRFRGSPIHVGASTPS